MQRRVRRSYAHLQELPATGNVMANAANIAGGVHANAIKMVVAEIGQLSGTSRRANRDVSRN